MDLIKIDIRQLRTLCIMTAMFGPNSEHFIIQEIYVSDIHLAECCIFCLCSASMCMLHEFLTTPAGIINLFMRPCSCRAANAHHMDQVNKLTAEVQTAADEKGAMAAQRNRAHDLASQAKQIMVNTEKELNFSERNRIEVFGCAQKVSAKKQAHVPLAE